MNEWLGILVNDGLLEGIRKNDTGHEKLDFYEEAGQRYGLIPCYFRLQDISLKNGSVLACLKRGQQWRRCRLPLPSVIHNRAIYQSHRAYQRCMQLEDKQIFLFNSWNRYGKLKIAHILSQNPDILPYLPVTLPFSKENLCQMTEKFPSSFFKPNTGTVGEGIIKIDRMEKDEWEIKFRSGTQLVKAKLGFGSLQRHLQRQARSYACLLQETIDLATYKGSPFDIRVSVQKDGKGKWGITGMVGKAARAGHFLSNVAQGGTVYPLAELLQEYPQLQPDKVVEEVSHASLAVAEHLEKHLPLLADVGFDFGITREGKPYFIEMNGRDLRYSFAKGNMLDTWKKTFENPVAYARYLLDQKKECGG